MVKKLLYPWMIGQFDACLYVGQRNRAYLEHYRARSDRLFFAPHCVDTLAFSEAASAVNRSEVRAGWGLQPQDHAVLFAGKLLARKRPDDLVNAAAQLVQQGKPVVLVWAGDGPERQSLQELGALLHVPMVFLGFCNQSRLPAIYRAADVLALPSEGSETWGLVVNEAMACGTPCVVSDASGFAPVMVLCGVTGEVYTMGQVDALTLALSKALMIERDTRQIAAHSARYSVAATASGVLGAAATLKKNKQP
jgi:glycosyltransferase involved in cell wall biosynthesis